LLVSRGKDITLKDSPAVLGLDWQAAVRELNMSDIPFDCALATAGAESSPGTVLAQEPGAGQPLKSGQKIKLTISAPQNIGGNQTFGIYQGSLAEYAVPVELTVSAVSAGGQVQTLWQFNHPGGGLSFPYLVETGSELVVSVFGKEIDRQLIKKN
jgi:beta-lactam-binding protein with PASTA domain